jgi:hypothetical protein
MLCLASLAQNGVEYDTPPPEMVSMRILSASMSGD